MAIIILQAWTNKRTSSDVNNVNSIPCFIMSDYTFLNYKNMV